MTWDEVRRRIPNALTIARFAAIPIFAWLFLELAEHHAEVVVGQRGEIGKRFQVAAFRRGSPE